MPIIFTKMRPSSIVYPPSPPPPVNNPPFRNAGRPLAVDQWSPATMPYQDMVEIASLIPAAGGGGSPATIPNIYPNDGTYGWVWNGADDTARSDSLVDGGNTKILVSPSTPPWVWDSGAGPNGINSAKSTYPFTGAGGADTGTAFFKFGLAAGGKVFVRFFYKQGPGPNWNFDGSQSNQDFLKLVRFEKSDFTQLLTPGCQPGGSLISGWDAWATGNFPVGSYNFNSQIGKWCCYEVMLDLSVVGTAHQTIWVNDVQVLDHTISVGNGGNASTNTPLTQVGIIQFDGTINSMADSTSSAWFTMIGISSQRMFMPPGFTLPTSGGFATPDIVNNAGFENSWTPFTNWSGDPPPDTLGTVNRTLTLDNTVSFNGSWSAKSTWAPASTDNGVRFINSFSGRDRVFVRFYFKLTNVVSSVWKFSRCYGVGFNTSMGGIAVGGGTVAGGGFPIIGWGWDSEDSGTVYDLGVPSNGSTILDGNWHSLEYDLWRNGDTSNGGSNFPSVAVWLDGNQLTKPNGSAGAQSAVWLNGRLNAGARGTSLQIGTIEWIATLNGPNSTSGTVWLDQVAVSTQRIGP